MIRGFARSWSVITIATLMISVIVGSLLVATSVALHSSYRFDLSLAERSQFIISSSLQNGALPFAIATEDNELMRSIIESQMQYEEVYAIEIKNDDGKILYRSEKQLHPTSLTITPRSIEIRSPYESVPLDGLDTGNLNAGSPETGNSHTSSLGTLTVYFSSDSLEDAIKSQAIFAGAILLLTIFVIAAVLYLFHRIITKHLRMTLKTMDAIKNGQSLDWSEPVTPSLKEMHILYDSLRQLSLAIFERDAKLNESLQQALDAKRTAEQAEHFKDDFIRAICHDIRTPVGVVLNLLALIRKDSDKYHLDHSLSDKLNACHQSAQVLDDVMSELFDFDQFQTMELIERKERVNVAEFFDRIAVLYAAKFESKNISFSITRSDTGTPDIPVTASFDQKKVTLIVENIVDNALKFTPSGSVQVEWGIFDHELRLRIKDSGIGIPEDKFGLIFDRHTQLQSPVTSQHEGRGLGLFYVKRLLDVIGATVKISSKLDIGTVFSIYIPITEVDDHSVQTPFNSPMVNKTASGSNLFSEQPVKVLIIDDDEGTCFTLSQMLAQYGIESTCENIPEIGYKRLITDAPDLVFIDYHMTGLSGDKLAQKAQNILSPNATFFVCITAESNRKSLAMLGEIFHEVYLKPFKAEILEDILKNVATSKSVTDTIISSFRSPS